MFKGSYLFKPIILGIHVSFRGCSPFQNGWKFQDGLEDEQKSWDSLRFQLFCLVKFTELARFFSLEFPYPTHRDASIKLFFSRCIPDKKMPRIPQLFAWFSVWKTRKKWGLDSKLRTQPTLSCSFGRVQIKWQMSLEESQRLGWGGGLIGGSFYLVSS